MVDFLGVSEDLQSILQDIVRTAAKVAKSMRYEQNGVTGGAQNSTGDTQLELDIRADRWFTNALKKNSHVRSLASEEMENEEIVSTENGGYSIAFDPLDGSSLVDVNLAVGSIFGIYKGKRFLKKTGKDQVASLIVVYGPRLTFLLTTGRGVDEYIFQSHDGLTEQSEVEAMKIFGDEDDNFYLGDFILSKSQLKVAPRAKMFAPGNLRACASEEWYVRLLNFWIKEGYTLRYSGGMVPDVNQILLKGGGIFTYPGYKEKPQGKLRLLYECAPMAFLMEQAGGKAIGPDGKNILDIEILDLHQKTPIFLGSVEEVELVKKFVDGGL